MKGFTLLELIIYIGILAMVLTIGSLILLPLLRSQTSFDVKKLVNTSIDSALETMARTIHNASSVKAVLPTDNAIQLTMTDAAKNPTRFRLNKTIQASGTAVFGSAWNEDIGDIIFNCESADNIPFKTGEDTFRAAVSDGTYGYFGVQWSSPGPAAIVKVRLSDFTRVGVLFLAEGETGIESAVIDTANGFAYFGLGTWPSKIAKIRLSDFTRVSVLTFTSGGAKSAVIGGGYAYFGSSWGNIVKIRLSDFTIVGTLQLSLSDTLEAAVIDMTRGSAGYAYFATKTNPGKIVKVNLATFTEVSPVLTLNSGDSFGNGTAGTIDTTAGFAYFGTTNNYQRIIKINIQVASPLRTDSLILPSNDNFTGMSAVVDKRPGQGFVYFSGVTNGTVYKIDIATFSLSSSLVLSGVRPRGKATILDPDTNALYTGSEYSGNIWRVDIASFSETARLDLDTKEQNGQLALFDSNRGFIYALTNTYPGKIIRFRQYDNLFDKKLDLLGDLNENEIQGGVIDTLGNYLYVVTDENRIVKIDLSTFSRVAGIDSGLPCCGGLTSAVIDSNSLYIGSEGNKIVKVNLTSFTVSKITTLLSDEKGLRSAVIDSAQGFIYFATGAESLPTVKIVKVKASDFTRVDALTLSGVDAIEWNSGAIDTRSGQGYAYFGSTNGKIVKVNIGSPGNPKFEIAEILVLSDSGWLRGAAIDYNNNAAYFGDSRRIYKINLSTFKEIGILYPDVSYASIADIALDSTSQIAYMPNMGNPLTLTMMNLESWKEVDTVSAYSQCGLSDFKVTMSPTSTPVTYGGYAWNPVIGWISFCGNPGGKCISPQFQVEEDGNGNLQNWAWNDAVGWISFNCKNRDTCATTDYKVARDSQGYLTGYAWNDVIGYIKFGGKGGQIMIKEGKTNEEQPLTDPKINYSKLKFTEVINPGAPHSVFINIIANYISNKAEEQYETERQTTSSLRK